MRDVQIIGLRICKSTAFTWVMSFQLLQLCSVGGTYTGFKSIADILKLQIMSTATFYRLQKTYVFPVIYMKYRDYLLEQCKERGFIDVSGDVRCDSPGYNAKFSTYSIMDELPPKSCFFT